MAELIVLAVGLILLVGLVLLLARLWHRRHVERMRRELQLHSVYQSRIRRMRGE